jgi:maleylacetoacetate isomerase
VPDTLVEPVSTGLETDDRGIMVFTMPVGDPVTEALGTTDLKAFNPEGRIPVLLLPDGRKMTQSGPIIDFIEDHMEDGLGPLLPDDRWARADAKRIMWIVAADTQPYQNIPFIIQAMNEWGMVKDIPTSHPLRLHFIRREFAAIEGILADSAGSFAVGDQVTLADCFLVPQIRNALLASIDLAAEFPIMARVFANLLEEPRVKSVVDAASGAVQPLFFDAESGEVKGRR